MLTLLKRERIFPIMSCQAGSARRTIRPKFNKHSPTVPITSRQSTGKESFDSCQIAGGTRSALALGDCDGDLSSWNRVRVFSARCVGGAGGGVVDRSIPVGTGRTLASQQRSP